MARHYVNMASKRTENETDLTERDKKIALNAYFTEDSNIIEIKSPEYLTGKTVIFETSLVCPSFSKISSCNFPTIKAILRVLLLTIT